MDEEEGHEPDGSPVGAQAEATGVADEAFALVGNETRLRILMELQESATPLTFSQLHERVGVRDSGQFNYHLNRLVGRFVRKGSKPGDSSDGEDDQGYRLTYAGERIVGAVYSGVFTRDISVGPVPVDGSCHECGGDLVATYEAERARVTCEACDLQIVGFGVPPTLVEDRAVERLPRTFDAWVRAQIDLASHGFCPLCTGLIEPVLDESPSQSWEDSQMIALLFECERCGIDVQSAVGAAYLSHPAVTSFHLDHGIDLSRTKLWNLGWLFEPHTNVIRMNPARFDVRIALDDEVLVCQVYNDFRVGETERTPR